VSGGRQVVVSTAGADRLNQRYCQRHGHPRPRLSLMFLICLRSQTRCHVESVRLAVEEQGWAFAVVCEGFRGHVCATKGSQDAVPL
jgi:hypothetical protein